MLVDLLPAVLREADEERAAGFLRAFVSAFEEVFGGLQAELDALPELVALTPAPALAAEAKPGDGTLVLDSAAGVWPGDAVQLDAPVELVRVTAVTGAPEPPELRTELPRLTPTILVLADGTRFKHALGTAVRPVGPAVATTSLAASFAPGAASVAVTDAAALVLAGDVLDVEGELLFAADVDVGMVKVLPEPQHGHEIATPVTVRRALEAATPPAAFTRADRSGAERVLTYRARGGADDRIFVDSVEGLAPGSVVWVRDPDPRSVEFVRVRSLKPGVKLEAPVAHDHAVGVALEALGPGRGPAVPLADPVGGGDDVVFTVDPPGVAPGDVVSVGGEPAQVLTVEGNRIALTPALTAHPEGAPVARVLPAAGGTALLAWLAGWLGLVLREDRGERFNRELVRLAGLLWPWRGTRRGLEAFLAAWLRGEADVAVRDAANPMQIGLVSTVGLDTAICGMPRFFWAELDTDPESRRMHQLPGIDRMIAAAHEAIGREKPAHTFYDLLVRAHTLQLGGDPDESVGARVGDTTLSWDAPVVVPGDEERGAGGWRIRAHT
jgi:hypothetical protein